MPCHPSGGERIADLVLHGLARAAGNAQQSAMISGVEDRKLRTALRRFLRAPDVAPCSNASGTAESSGATRYSNAALTSANGFAAWIRTCSTFIGSRTVDGLAIAVSDPILISAATEPSRTHCNRGECRHQLLTFRDLTTCSMRQPDTRCSSSYTSVWYFGS